MPELFGRRAQIPVGSREKLVYLEAIVQVNVSIDDSTV
jgi:hypothetical protein